MRVFKLSWFSMSAHNFLLVSFLLIHHQVLAQKIDNSLRHTQKKAEWYVTSSNQQKLLFKEVLFDSGKQLSDGVPVIKIDGSKTFQSIDGFGYTLTEASAVLINRLPPQTQEKLLQELFGRANESIAISYLRIGMGATDLSTRVYSYNDLLPGETDPELKRFSLAQDTADLIPLLKRILQINPAIRIMATPWSPPVWMKDNNSTIGGRLLTQYYRVYARYFVEYIRKMKSEGIRIDAVTIQNEPQNAHNNPSLKMEAVEQAAFIRDHLGPAFRRNGISTKIIVWDHNCDMPEFPVAVLSDKQANAFIDGSAFHLYGGQINAMSAVKDAFPDKNIYFTEQWTGSKGDFGGDLMWHFKNVLIGSLRNWSRTVLEWNLANDAGFGPHTPGGCSECKGALTIDGAAIQKNVSYFIIAHASKFIPPGSVRIASSEVTGIPSVAFKTPDGKIVLLLMNDSGKTQKVGIEAEEQQVQLELQSGLVATVQFNKL
jgi:glucosylceramidase